MVHWNIDSIWRYPILNGMFEQNSIRYYLSTIWVQYLVLNTSQLYNAVEHFNKISKFCFRLTTIIFSTIKVWPREAPLDQESSYHQLVFFAQPILSGLPCAYGHGLIYESYH